MGEDERRSPRDRAADEAAWQDLVSRLGDVGQDDGPGPAAGDGRPPRGGEAPQPPVPTGIGPRDYALD